MRTTRYLSAREQQIMDIVYQRGQVTATDVMEALPDALSNSAVRTHLRLLEGKGQLRHTEVEGKYVYLPTHPRQSAAQSALTQLLTTFFDGSVEKVMATLLSVKRTDLTSDELDRLQEMIDQARERE
jgi:BlaI family transcriptional regulator, penicillinase repressor